jgi:O-antigen ligase
MAPLAIVQFFLPASAFLNKELVGDDEGVFLVTADIVRTTGTFSFALGYSIFLAVASPFVLSLLTPGNRLRGGKWKSIAIVLVLAFATIVSGSRSALVMFGLLFLAYIFISIRYSKVSQKGSTVFLLAGVLLLLSVVPYIFSEAMDALLERFETAAEIEDFSQRMVTILFGEQDVYERFKLIGHGIGAGNNFANSTASNGVVFLLEETESARTVLEGGLVGIVFIGIKLLVIIIGLRHSRRIAKSSSNMLPLLLWFSLAIGLLTWPIIGQLTANVLGYLLLGLGIASLRLSDNRI